MSSIALFESRERDKRRKMGDAFLLAAPPDRRSVGNRTLLHLPVSLGTFGARYNFFGVSEKHWVLPGLIIPISI